MNNKKIQLKENDVYHLRVDWKKNPEWNYGNNHCFEGTLVVVKDYKNELVLADTFWGVGRLDEYTKVFNLKKAEELGELIYYCNLSELKEIQDYEQQYYEDNDVYLLSTQHACSDNCKNYYIKKGTKRSTRKMLEEIDRKIKEQKDKIDSGVREIERLSAKRVEIDNGKTNIYF